MRLISYLCARILNRRKLDKEKRIFPGKFVYLTSSNPWGESRGTLKSVYVLMREFNWRGEMKGLVEAPTVEELRDWVKKKYGIESFVIPKIVENKIKYSSRRLDLETGIIIDDISILMDNYDDALEKSCLETIRDNKKRGD